MSLIVCLFVFLAYFYSLQILRIISNNVSKLLLIKLLLMVQKIPMNPVLDNGKYLLKFDKFLFSLNLRIYFVNLLFGVFSHVGLVIQPLLLILQVLDFSSLEIINLLLRIIPGLIFIMSKKVFVNYQILQKKLYLWMTNLFIN